MKKEWETVPLEAVAVQKKGAIKIGPFGSQLKKRDLVSSGIHVVGIENILSETFDGLGERFISPEKFQTLRTVEIFPGDLLITMMGTIGKVAVVPDGIETSIMDSHLLRVRPDTNLCRTDYLKWAVYGSPAVQESMDAQAHGAIMKGLNSAIVRSLPILLPPLSEQRRIVDILDKAFENIAIVGADAEKNLHNARALFASHLNTVFTKRGPGWMETTLGETYDVRDGTHDSPRYHATGYPLITSKNLKREGLSFENVKLISEQDYKKINERSEVHKGDVLLAMIGTIGNPTLVTVEPLFAIKNVALLKIPKGQSGAFVKHYLDSESVVSKMIKEAKGTTQRFVGLGYLRAFPINVPPLATQLEIVERINKFERETQHLEFIYQRKLVELDALRKSLLNAAFSGKL